MKFVTSSRINFKLKQLQDLTKLINLWFVHQLQVLDTTRNNIITFEYFFECLLQPKIRNSLLEQ